MNGQKRKPEIKRIVEEELFGSPDAYLAQGTFPFPTTHLPTPVYLL